MLVYLDTNIVVYLVEQPPEWGALTARRLRELADGGHRFAVSHLVRMECRVRPLRLHEEEVLAAYDAYFVSGDLAILELGAAVFDRAADLRAVHGLRALDALHLAAALEGLCDAFLTNDEHLRAFPALEVIPLPTASDGPP